MKPKIIFVERKPSGSVSIERVFSQIAKNLPNDKFEVEFQSVPFGNGVVAIVKNLLFFRRRPADLYHVTGDVHYITLRLPADRTVLTIHDLIFLRRRTGIRRYALKLLFLIWPVKRVAQTTVVSAATEREIFEQNVGPRFDIEVIDNPLVDGFCPEPQKDFNSDTPVLLQIGTAKNKNLQNLIAAVEGLRCKLKIIGQLDGDVLESLRRYKVDFENANHLDEKQIVQEYRNADIVTFCSTYEGFGLPIVEAQAMKKPVITSDLPPMNSVAGDGAVLVDPHDISSIRAGLDRVISDSEYRNRTIQCGVENVARFNGVEITKRYVEIYERILSSLDQSL